MEKSKHIDTTAIRDACLTSIIAFAVTCIIYNIAVGVLFIIYALIWLPASKHWPESLREIVYHIGYYGTYWFPVLALAKFAYRHGNNKALLLGLGLGLLAGVCIVHTVDVWMIDVGCGGLGRGGDGCGE